jgi:hypothetical protein
MRGNLNVPKHTDEEIERAAARIDEWARSLDPADFEDILDLRAVAEAAGAIRDEEARLRAAVRTARVVHGRSWNQIAIALGVSRQAARQRFAEKASNR